MISIDIITIDYIRRNENFADLCTKDFSRYQVVKSPKNDFILPNWLEIPKDKLKDITKSN